MDYLTGGRFRATLHRVVNKTGAARYSIPFFYEPNMEAVLEPLISADDPRKQVSFFVLFTKKTQKNPKTTTGGPRHLRFCYSRF